LAALAFEMLVNFNTARSVRASQDSAVHNLVVNSYLGEFLDKLLFS